MTTVLSAENLRKEYSGVLAVDNLSFILRKGEILGLVGPNGSGKTTTIQMLLGTLSMTSGKISYFGKELEKHRSEILQKVTFASTYTNLPWTLTIAQNLEVFGYLYGISPIESAKKFEPLLDRFGILHKARQSVSTLSAGQITRLMLVKAFFIEPKIVLLDEPTASLDPEIANDICSFLLEQREKLGTSLLFSSHKMGEIMEICDRAIFLKEGKLVADDRPDKLAKSASAFRLKLVITEGLKRLIDYVQKEKFEYLVDHHSIELLIEEEKIPSFLNELSVMKVNYANIRIEEPSLEDYFLQISKKT